LTCYSGKCPDIVPSGGEKVKIILVLSCFRMIFPVFKRSECESFPSADFAIAADISSAGGKSSGPPAGMP
jgi:hypothetical protein